MLDYGVGSRGSIHALDSKEGSVKRYILEEVDTMVGGSFPADIVGNSGRQMGA